MKSGDSEFLHPSQSRMARAALRWGIEDLAHKAGLAENTIVAFEAGRAVRGSSIYRIKDALEQFGVKFSESPPWISVATRLES